MLVISQHGQQLSHAVLTLPPAPGPAPLPAGAMVVAAGTGSALLVGVEPLELGLPGVWYALGLLMTSRLATMIWRYQSATGPLPPSGVHPSPGPAWPLLVQSWRRRILHVGAAAAAAGSP